MTLHIYDATELDCLARCEEEHSRRYIQHITSGRDADATHAGSILHIGRNEYFLHEDANAAVAAMRDAWGDYVPGSTEKRTLDVMVTMMLAYHEYVGPPSKRGFKVLLGEQPVVNEREQHGGRIDAIEECQQEIIVDDLKTSAMSMSAAALASFDHNEQIAGYLDRAEELVGRPVACAYIESWFISFRKEGPKAEDFKRHGPIYYADELRAEFRTRRHEMIEHGEALRRGLRAPRKNPFACRRYNGACMFLPACKSNLDMREAVVQSRLQAGEWVEKEWDFTKRDAK